MCVTKHKPVLKPCSWRHTYLKSMLYLCHPTLCLFSKRCGWLHRILCVVSLIGLSFFYEVICSHQRYSSHDHGYISMHPGDAVKSRQASPQTPPQKISLQQSIGEKLSKSLGDCLLLDCRCSDDGIAGAHFVIGSCIVCCPS